MEGFVQLHKKICDWEWYTDIPTKTLFLHVLLKCNFKEVKWKGKIVKPGEFITSIEHLSLETGLTRQQVRTAINKLKITGEITHYSTNEYTTLALNNWESYNTPDNKRITNEQQTNNKRITTTNKEYNEYKEYNENKETISKDTEQAPNYVIEVLEDKDSTEIQSLITEKITEAYGKEEINMMQAFLRQAVGLTAFKDSKERWYVTHCYNLMRKIGKEEFQIRLKEILSDPFKAKNCNKLSYLYGELKSYIHSPVIKPKQKESALDITL